MTGAYVNSWDTSVQSTDPYGITTDGTNIWIVDEVDDEVYKYDMTGTYINSFDTSDISNDPYDITTDGTNIWIVDIEDNKAYKCDMTHTANTGEEFGYNLSRLLSTTLYHYRSVSNNSNSTVYGSDMTFITKASWATLHSRFAYAPTVPKVDESVFFTDLSNGAIISWSWNFGDGHTSVGINQVHTYDESGSYTVTLKITDATGSDTSSRSIYIMGLEDPYVPTPIKPKEPEGYNVSDTYDVLKVLDLPVSDNKITVVIIDTGFTPTIYDGINMQNVEGYALSHFESEYDDNGHGTFTIYEIMYITQNKCPNAKIISYKTFDEFGAAKPNDFLNALDAVKYMRPDIVSISAGAIGNPLDEYSMKIKEMREYGIIVVASAAGNLGPAPGTILSPACSDYAIAVGAFDTKGTLTLVDDEICSWSSRGPVLDISPKPDIVAPGESILGPWLYSEKSVSGTSMSAPFIVGGTAVVISQNKPLLNIVKLMYFWNLGVVGDAYEGALKDSCTAVGDENIWGAGVPDFVKVNDNFHNRLLILIIIPIVLIVFIAAIIVAFYLHKRNNTTSWTP